MIDGIYSAMITPFDENEQLDEVAFANLIEDAVKSGLHGIFVGASTGESWALSIDEKLRLFHLAVDIAGGRLRIMAGVGANSTRESLVLLEAAITAGIESVCAVQPSFCRPSQEELIEHYSALAKASSVPLLLYNVPILAGNPLAAATVRHLAETYPQIAGIKDSSGDITFVNQILADRHSGFSVMNGIDTLVLPVLQAGGQGAILSSANFCPELSLGIFRLVQEGNFKKAQQLQDSLSRIWLSLGVGSFPAAVKAAADARGRAVGNPRQPILPLSPSQCSDLRQRLEEIISTAKL